MPFLASDGLDPRRSKPQTKFTGTLSQPTGHAGPVGGTAMRYDGTDCGRCDTTFKGQPIRKTEVGSPASGEGPAYRGNGRSV